MASSAFPRVALHRLTGQTLAACWLAQALLAVLFTQALPIPARPLVLDRGACGAVEWQELVRRYRELLLQQRLGLRRFTPVIETSVFGERVTLDPPRPELLASAVPVGVRQGARLAALRDRYPSALVLSCRDTEPPAAP
ncbi:MAG: hypothetical protein ACK6AD_10730 [Cyanobacteriota bacterium]|jgi:hypothetical protein